jgi:hypothetical protein
VEIHEDGLAVASFKTDLQTPVYSLGLYQNHPNPFNPETSIGFTLPEDGQVRLEIYNLSGKRVRVLADEKLPAGLYTRIWDGRGSGGEPAATGVYFVRLKSGKNVVTRKCTLLR